MAELTDVERGVLQHALGLDRAKVYWWTLEEHAPSTCEPAGCGPEWWRTLEEAEDFQRRLYDSPAWTAMSVEEARQEEARLFWARRGGS